MGKWTDFTHIMKNTPHEFNAIKYIRNLAGGTNHEGEFTAISLLANISMISNTGQFYTYWQRITMPGTPIVVDVYILWTK